MNYILHLPSLEERIANLKGKFSDRYGVPSGEVQIAIAPYRICPLGAHVDHQLGKVTGMAINQSVLLAFSQPLKNQASDEIIMNSLNFEGEVRFRLRNIPPRKGKEWANYICGAAEAVVNAHGIQKGLVGLIEGDLPVGGLSSSAAVGIAYLLALEQVNGIAAGIRDNIHFDHHIEHNYIGLNNGILDQSVILTSRKDHLVHLDCQNEQWELIDGVAQNSFEILMVHSGVTESLVGTGYNDRVAECLAAGAEIYRLAGKGNLPALPLRNVEYEDFVRHEKELPEVFRKRARHFFTEQQRVVQGVNAWRNNDLLSFGELIRRSGLSSIENYECGCPPLITLYHLLNEQPGVLGARFSGAGFRGCCVALVKPAHAQRTMDVISEAYPRKHPEYRENFCMALCRSDDGARLIQ